MSNFTIIIPCRYQSERLPGKVLLPLAGKTVIEHVIDRARASSAQKVIVATDDTRIAEHVQDKGVTVCMTASCHQSASDRLAEVIDQLNIADDTIIVNLQGDEPFMPAANLAQVANNLAAHSWASVATLCEPITELAQFTNPNVVKVVFDTNGRALYFSRAPIPWDRNWQSLTDITQAKIPVNSYRHLGLYAYRAGFLKQFSQTPPAKLEQLEKLEQLRVLQMGAAIHISLAQEPSALGIDTAADLAQAEQLLAVIS